MRPGIVELIGRINSIPGIEEIYMTTNGILHDKVEALAKNGLKGKYKFRFTKGRKI